MNAVGVHGLDDQVAQHLLRATTAPAVVIIGANTDTGAEFLALRPDLQVWLVEPLPECVAELRLFAQGDPTRVHVVPYAVSDFDGAATFHANAWSITSSLRLPTARCHGLGVPRELYPIPAQVRKVASLVEEGLLPPRADYVVVDTQGSGLEVLLGGTEFFRASTMAFVEVEFAPLYDGQALYPQVQAELEELGYQAATAVVADPDRASWQDVLYVKKPVL